MATRNFNGALKALQESNLSGVQLITGTNPSNVIGILYGGYKFDRMSAYITEDFEDFFANLKELGAEEMYKQHMARRNSAATHKVNDACGRSYRERATHKCVQIMTYAKSFENIKMDGYSWIEVFNQFVDRELTGTLNRLSYWAEAMKEWHGKKTESVINKMINSGDIRVLDGHIIPEDTFKKLLNTYCDTNKYNRLSDTKMVELIDAYCNRFKAVVEGV